MSRAQVVGGPALVITDPYTVRMVLEGVSRLDVAGTPELRELRAAAVAFMDAWRNGRNGHDQVPSRKLAEVLDEPRCDGVEWLSAKGAAEALGVSTARVRFIAERLGGVQGRSGAWCLPAAKVEWYRQQQEQRRSA